jgi:hypothetical protein
VRHRPLIIVLTVALALACPSGPGAERVADPSPVATGPCTVADAVPEKDERPDGAWLRAFRENCVDVDDAALEAQGWVGDKGPIRLTGPFIDKQEFGSHQRVRVWYSPRMAQWVKDADAARRQGKPPPAVPVGARMVKRMYDPKPPDDPNIREDVDGVAFMQRTDGDSFDSWFWALYFRPNSKATGRAPGFLSAQHGVSFCQTCHAVVADQNGTFAHLGNLTGKDPVSYTMLRKVLQDQVPFPDAMESTPELGPHGSLAFHLRAETTFPCLDLPFVHGGELPCDREIRLDPTDPRILQVLYNDFAVPGKRNPTDWMSADACQHCHDAALLQAGRTPQMMKVVPVGQQAEPDPEPVNHFYNLTPYGEGNSSLMARSARDPVFLAQLEYEQERAGERVGRDEISDFCLACHAPMAQRAWKTGEGGAPLPEEVLHEKPGDTHAIYGALARSGVSCNVCHRIAPAGRPEDAFNANFDVIEPGKVRGPFPAPKTWAMKNAIGVEPVFHDGMGSGEICISCHTVKPPIVDPDEPAGPLSEAKTANEQMTWWEWANSDYADSGGKTCVGCHMPNDFQGELLGSTAIANIQTPDFPYSHAHPKAEDVTLPERVYRRHTLTGINLFTLEMFRLLWYRTGVQLGEVGLPNKTFPRSEMVAREALRLAREDTASVGVQISRSKEGLVVDVDVESQVGHKFPSGVHFRRAWLEVSVLDSDSEDADILWCSGCPDRQGYIHAWRGGDDEGVLASETTSNPAQLQPHQSEIDDPGAVRLYEEAYAQNGKLVTSFLGLEQRLKDTKILPLGWSQDGPMAAETAPVECPSWPDKCGVPIPDPVGGIDRVRYVIDLADVSDRARAVRVQLHYQPLPPHYLGELGSGPHRDFLKTLVSCLQDSEEDPYRLFQGWTVPVSCDRFALASDGAGQPASCLPQVRPPTTDPVTVYTPRCTLEPNETALR